MQSQELAMDRHVVIMVQVHLGMGKSVKKLFQHKHHKKYIILYKWQEQVY